MTRREIRTLKERDDVVQERLFRLIIFCQCLGLAAIAGLILAGLIWR